MIDKLMLINCVLSSITVLLGLCRASELPIHGLARVVAGEYFYVACKYWMMPNCQSTYVCVN